MFKFQLLWEILLQQISVKGSTSCFSLNPFNCCPTVSCIYRLWQSIFKIVWARKSGCTESLPGCLSAYLSTATLTLDTFSILLASPIFNGYLLSLPGGICLIFKTLKRCNIIELRTNILYMEAACIQKVIEAVQHNWTYITYIIGHYNPSVRIIDLVSHTTNVVCVNFIHKWRDLQFKVDSER